MNKRQRKKNYKKQHGVNPPTRKQLQSLDIPRIIPNIADIFQGIFEALRKTFENIQAMPDAEFEAKLHNLTPEEKRMALKIRGKEDDGKW